jgi:hypothetical protein
MSVRNADVASGERQVSEMRAADKRADCKGAMQAQHGSQFV